jgi:hypothetical protein
MTEKSFIKSEFYHCILLDKSVAEVFKYAATPGGLEKWFIGKAEFLSEENTLRKSAETVKQGDKYKIDWLAKDLSVRGEVLECIVNSHFRFTFGTSFIVTISVSEQGSRTLFRLKQEYAAGAVKNDFAHINCCVCWGFFVTNLKSVAEHAIDLRETESEDETLVNR